MLNRYTSKKLTTLANVEGFETIDELMEEEMYNDMCGPLPGMAGICMNPNCEYCTRVDPDSESGWCENCNDNSVASWMILMGII